MTDKFITKDSGQRAKFDSGMQRDIQDDKPRFDLIVPLSQRYDNTLLYRWAMLMTRGAKKYNERNWEKAESIEELSRFKASAMRHFFQAMCGEEDEDHFAAICFNINGLVYLMEKLGVNVNGIKVGRD